MSDSKAKAKPKVRRSRLVQKASLIEQRRREVEALKSKFMRNADIAKAMDVSVSVIESDLRAIREMNLNEGREPIQSELLLIGFQEVLREMWEAVKECKTGKDKVLALRTVGNQLKEFVTVAQSLGYLHREPTKIEIENRRREEALRLQTELTQSQIDYLEAKRNAMARGEGLFTVQCDGLKPHLEAILWEIVEAARFRVNQEHGEFLAGI